MHKQILYLLLGTLFVKSVLSLEKMPQRSLETASFQVITQLGWWTFHDIIKSYIVHQVVHSILYDVSVPYASKTILLDYTGEAISAACIKGPKKIPYALVSYACVDRLYGLIQKTKILSLQDISFLKQHYFLKMALEVCKPLLIKAALRVAIEIIIDYWLSDEELIDQETDSL